MKLWVKNLKGDKFEIDIEPSCKTKEVKECVFKAQGYEVAQQKLIVQGKIMQDEVQISEYNIKEGDFIVVMVQKPKPSPQTKAVQQAPVQPSTQQVQQQSPRQIQPPVVQEQQQAEPSNFYDQSISSLVTGQELEKTINGIVEMGFPREEVIAALKAAYNNPDRAIEYLMTGIPQNTQHSHRTQQNQQRQQSSRSQRHHQASGSQQQQASQRSTFSALVNNPNFEQTRQMLQQNPQLLGQVLQQIRTTNPQLFQLINDNQQEFLQLLQQPPQTQNTPQQIAQNLVRQMQPQSQGSRQIQVTQNEKEAIEKIVSIGFNKKQVLQAYFACEKNEEATVNFLLQEQAEEQKELPQIEQQLLQQSKPQQSQQSESNQTEQQQPQQNQAGQQQAEKQQAGQQQAEKEQMEQQQKDQQKILSEQEKQENEQQQQEPKESAKKDNEQPPPS